MENSSSPSSEAKKGRLPLWISLVVLGVLVTVYFFVPAFSQFCNEAWTVLTSNDESRINNWVSSFGWYGPLVLVLAMVAQMFLLVIPTIVLMIVAILAYGPLWGSVLVVVAVFVASTVGFGLGKYFGTFFIVKLLGEKSMHKVSGFLDRYGFWAVFITRLNPFLSNDAISFVAGILKMRYWKFMAATLSGITPLVFFLALTGKNTQSLKQGLLWGSLVSLLLFGIYIYLDKKRGDSKS